MAAETAIPATARRTRPLAQNSAMKTVKARRKGSVSMVCSPRYLLAVPRKAEPLLEDSSDTHLRGSSADWRFSIV